MTATFPTHLSDADLLSALIRCAADERGSTARLVTHLAEVDRRELHRASGYGSLFAYCCGELKLSEGATYNRIEAARTARRFPVVLDRLADGSLTLANLRLLSRHLTAEN